MNLLWLVVPIVATVMLIYLLQHGDMPPPIRWLLIAIAVIVWLVILVNSAGLGVRIT